MSYILDALKKSEKERQRGRVPDLMAAQDVMGEGPKRRTFWPYLIVGALILNAGLLVYWLAWNSGKPPAAGQATTFQRYGATTADQGNRSADAGSSAVTSQPTVPNVGDVPLRPVGEKERVSGPGIPPAGTQGALSNALPQPRQEQVKSETRKNVETKPVTAMSAGVPSGIPSASTEQPQAAKLTGGDPQPVDRPVPVKNKLYSLHDLPASIRQDLPAFAISTHLYASDVSSRVVRINGQVLREGQFLAEGLKVEEIIPEGVIFSYRNYRFRVMLK